MNPFDTMSPLPEDIEFLEHHGVKGQKWGVRRQEKRVAKADKKFEKGVDSSTYFKVYNSMADRMNKGEIDRINNDPRFKNRDVSDINDPITKAYHKEYSDTATRILNEASNSIIGTNASGTRKVQFDYDVMNDSLPRLMIVDTGTISHEDSNSYELDVEFDDMGRILKINIPEDLIQTIVDDNINNALAHFGIKGMRWGVRRNSVSKVRSKTPTARTKAKKMSDDELQTAIKRMELEKKYVELDSKTSTVGKQYAKGLIQEFGKSAGKEVVGAVVAGTIGVLLATKFGPKK